MIQIKSEFFDKKASTSTFKKAGIGAVKSKAGKRFQASRNVKAVTVIDPETSKVFMRLAKDADGHMVERKF